MNRNTIRVGIITALTLVGLLLSGAVMAQMDQPAQKRIDPISESDIAYRYRLFETTNIWNFILLDTATGRAWQVHYSLDDTPAGRSVINEYSLLPKGAISKNGRFTLYPTHNMYTYLISSVVDFFILTSSALFANRLETARCSKRPLPKSTYYLIVQAPNLDT
jgi:hypothetical protein